MCSSKSGELRYTYLSTSYKYIVEDQVLCSSKSGELRWTIIQKVKQLMIILSKIYLMNSILYRPQHLSKVRVTIQGALTTWVRSWGTKLWYRCWHLLQGVSVKVWFSPSMSQGLNLIKYCWSMTLSLPRHGRFSYITETFM